MHYRLLICVSHPCNWRGTQSAVMNNFFRIIFKEGIKHLAFFVHVVKQITNKIKHSISSLCTKAQQNASKANNTCIKKKKQKPMHQCCLLSHSDLESKGTWHDWCSWRKIFCNFPYSSRSKYNLPSCNEKKVIVLRCIKIPQL